MRVDIWSSDKFKRNDFLLTLAEVGVRKSEFYFEV
jgi:hypothetical protein